jgi:predicted heme/steroid binding protein
MKEMNNMEKEFSEKELAQNNGKNGTSALVVYNGKVYDVSKSNRWEDGNHENMHDAGKDLTYDLETATPHGTDLLDKFPIVGMLKT